MKLYPLKFEPIVKEKVWGGNYLFNELGKGESADKKYGESWEISTVGEDISTVSNGFLAGNNLQEVIEIYMAEIVGKELFEKYGLYFPLLIKFIDAQDDLSIQVHPDDNLGLEKYNSFGKTEMWYIMDTTGNAKIINGFSKPTTPDDLRKDLTSPDLVDRLNVIDTNKGDVYYIPAGRVHALMSGNVVIEIQQPSDITFRLYDYNRPGQDGKLRELHIEQGVEASDYSVSTSVKTKYEPTKNAAVNLADTPFFTTNIMNYDQRIGRDYYFLDSFVILICSEGSFDIEYNDGEKVAVKQGETVLIPADLKQVEYNPTSKTVSMLEVYIDKDKNA